MVAQADRIFPLITRARTAARRYAVVRRLEAARLVIEAAGSDSLVHQKQSGEQKQRDSGDWPATLPSPTRCSLSGQNEQHRDANKNDHYRQTNHHHLGAARISVEPEVRPVEPPTRAIGGLVDPARAPPDRANNKQYGDK